MPVSRNSKKPAVGPTHRRSIAAFDAGAVDTANPDGVLQKPGADPAASRCVSYKEPPSVLSGGAATYGLVLAGAGGREVHALPQAAHRPSVEAALYVSPPYALHVPPLTVSRLAVNLTSAYVCGGIDGERPRRFNARRHSLFLTPAGAPVTWRKESSSRHVSIYFQSDVFDGAATESPLAAAPPPLFNVKIPGIQPLVEQFSSELQVPGILHAEAADSLARLLLIRLARHLHGASGVIHVLPSKVVARLREYVAAHLDERILVADLAKQAGLSANRFALSFTRTLGLSPHRFVLALRVQRAMDLLAQSDASLATIACECGFANQQHMSNVLTRRLGVAPFRYRVLRRNAAEK